MEWSKYFVSTFGLKVNLFVCGSIFALVGWASEESVHRDALIWFL